MVFQQTHETDFLQVEDGEPNRIKVSLLQEEQTFQMRMEPNGSKDFAEPDPLLGRSVLFTRDGDAWSKQLVGSPPTDKQRQAVEACGDPWSDDLGVEGKIRVGDSWTVAGDRFGRVFDAEMKGVTGQLACRFEEVVDFQQEPCALISVQLDMTANLTGEVGGKLSISGEGFVYRSLATKLDVSTRITGVLEVESQELIDGQWATMTIRGPVVVEATVTKN